MLWKVSQVCVHGWIRLQGSHFSKHFSSCLLTQRCPIRLLLGLLCQLVEALLRHRLTPEEVACAILIVGGASQKVLEGGSFFPK